MADSQVSTETIMLLQMRSEFQREFKSMAAFRQAFNETFLEQKKNFAAINAQLHIIQARLQTLESQDTPVPKHAWVFGQGIPHNTAVDSQRKLPNMTRRKSEDTREYDGLNGNESVHRECLMEQLEAMVKDMDLTNTSILDDLLGEECLTQDEASNIKERPSRKDQVRKLIVLMAKRSANKFVKFLETIERNCHYPHIAQEIKKIYENKIKEGRRPSCLICTIKRDVDIKDVIDKLCKHRIVDVEFLDLVVSHSISSRYQSSLWEVVFSKIDQSSNRRYLITVLQNALYAKYERLSAALGTCPLLQLSSHVCSAADTKEFDPNMKVTSSSWRSYTGSTSSISEQSTTSDFKRSSQKMKQKKVESDSVHNSKPSHDYPSKVPSTAEDIADSFKNVSNGSTLENLKISDKNEPGDKSDEMISLPTFDDTNINTNIPYCIAWLKSVDDTPQISDSDDSNIKSLDSNIASDLIVEQIEEEQYMVRKDAILKHPSGDSKTFQDDPLSNDAQEKDKNYEYQCDNDKREYVKCSSTDSGYSKQDGELSSPEIKETDEDDTNQIQSTKFLHHERNQTIMDNADTDRTDELSGMTIVGSKSVEVVQNIIKNDNIARNEMAVEQFCGDDNIT